MLAGSLFSMTLLISSIYADDICHLRKDSGPCLAYIERFYYNSISEKCENFIYGGCLGNKNNFKTIENCEKLCARSQSSSSQLSSPSPSEDISPSIIPNNGCHDALDIGPCKALISRYYYNNLTNECSLFFWGGCQGNANNFESYEICSKKCIL